MANVGEWSEVYAFFKLLADGKLHCGDGHLNRYDDRFYPILEIFRNDAPDRNAYKVNAGKREILVAGESISLTIPQSEFGEEAKNLLNILQDHNLNDVNLEAVRAFMTKIDCGAIKAKSLDKADIRIVIHNLATGSRPELGYSIKSKIGGNSTLINSNRNASNFVYKIEGINDKQMAHINSLDRFKQKFDYMKEVGATCSFFNVAEDILRDNLTMLDLGLARILGDSLLHYYSGAGSSIDEICRVLTAKDPLKICTRGNQPMYEYKFKQFLLAFALGMTVSAEWYGSFHANGGYIVVKEDGDIVCFHFFDRNDLEDYLFHHTKFDTPSTSRHCFGEVYKELDSYFIKLNMQVRFK